MLSSAPRRLPGSPVPPASQPRSRVSVAVSGPARRGGAAETTGPLCGGGPGRGSGGIFILRGSCSQGAGAGRGCPLIAEPQPAGPAVGAGTGIPLGRAGRAACPCPLPGGPGRGAAGGAGPISILIAGLGGPSGPRPNYRANPRGASGTGQAHSLHPGLPASRTVRPNTALGPCPCPPPLSQSPCRSVRVLLLLHPFPHSSTPLPRPLSLPLHLFPQSHSSIAPRFSHISVPSSSFSIFHSWLAVPVPACLSISPSPRLPTLLTDRASEHRHMCPTARALPRGSFRPPSLALARGRACSPSGRPAGRGSWT